MEEKESQARALLDKTNRQFNECNALYHAAAQRCGLSDAAFWTLYALVTSCEPLTQNRIAADWGIPKQTLNSAVAAMVKKGLLALCPGKGAHSGKIVTLTAEGRALAGRTVVPVIAAEEKAIRAFGLASAEEMHRLAQRHLECLQREFEKIARSGPGMPGPQHNGNREAKARCRAGHVRPLRACLPQKQEHLCQNQTRSSCPTTLPRGGC